jgi:uncharacterized protein (DUF1330 family)
MVLSLLVDFKYLLVQMKKKKHNDIIKDYDKIKSKHLDQLASKMLANDEKMNQLKGKEINPKFLDLF